MMLNRFFLSELCDSSGASRRYIYFSGKMVQTASHLCFSRSAATCSTKCQIEVEEAEEALPEKCQTEVEEAEEAPPKNSVEFFKRWGCNDSDLAKIFSRRPALRNASVGLLHSKLTVLQNLGFSASHLVQIISCRPHFLSYSINGSFDERMEYFTELFGSKEMVLKAIVVNPSLLRYDLHKKIKPVVAHYESMGVNKQSFVQMLMSRPALISRTHFDDGKLEFIHKTGVPQSSKLYKYIVTIVGISRLETLLGKIANLEKFGFQEEQVWQLVGRSPFLLTLAVDKVQRNMTYIVGTLKLPTSVVLSYPALIYASLETVMKPRVLLAGKIEEMGLEPRIEGPLLLKAIKMRESTMIKVYISCHPEDVAKELMEFYDKVKGLKRLAQASKKAENPWFPF